MNIIPRIANVVPTNIGQTLLLLPSLQPVYYVVHGLGQHQNTNHPTIELKVSHTPYTDAST